ncbi:MAG: hypothetical protein H7Y38_19255 [Armatimonadetes bacterium]|nr:hypothetical protein [Armatimonadota bacterium]
MAIAFAQMMEALMVLAIGLLSETLLAALWCWLYPVRVGDSGVAATDFWGRKLSLSWGEIETVTATRFCGLPYLKVVSFRKDRAVLWLPLFVRDPEAMRQAIVSSASAQNPLRQFVEGRGNAEPLAAR